MEEKEKPNKEGYTMTDVVNFYVDKFIEKGLCKTKKQAKDILIEAMFRNIVVDEIETMALFIADEEKYYKIYHN